jgi:hypothetical protein
MSTPFFLRYWLLAFLFCLLVYPAIAQTPDEKLAPTVFPPAPNATALGLYGDVPVSPYAGLPDITVPLTTIQTKAHLIPINLSYRASGVRVDEEASWVGLCWSLNAGGVITRSIRGLDDLSPSNHGFPLLAVPFPTYDNDNLYVPGSNIGNDFAFFSHVACDNKKFGDAYDTEPDQFYFNFAGHTGKFILDKSTSISTLKVRILDNSENLKIEAINTAQNSDLDWIVTTVDGYKYYFQEKEISYISVPGYSDMTLPCTSSWYLKSVVSPNGESVTFNYTRVSSKYRPQVAESMVQVFARELKRSGKYCNYDWESYDPKVGDPLENGTGRISTQSITTSGPILSNIIYANGRIDFAIANRDDIERSNAGSVLVPKRITGMTIRQGAGINQRTLRTIVFTQSYFNTGRSQNAPNQYTGIEYDYLRLRLDAVSEAGSTSTIPSYQFTYWGGTTTSKYDNLPPKVSFNKDHFGYFNLTTSYDNDDKHSAIGELNVQTTSQFTGTTFAYHFDGANRAPNLGATRIGTLRSIQYPTGGTTQFDYELHDFVKGSSRETGCGLRIYKITTQEGRSPARVKQYGYSDGRLMAPVAYGQIPTGYINKPKGCLFSLPGTDPAGMVDFYFFTVKRTSSSLSPLGSSAQGQPIGYSTVTELDGEGGINGKTVFEYSNQQEQINYTAYVLNVPNITSPLNGCLLSKTIYKYKYYDFVLGHPEYARVAATYNVYTADDPSGNFFPDVTAAVVSPDWVCSGSGAWTTTYGLTDAEVLRKYSVKYYVIPVYWKRLLSTIERQYDINDETKYTDVTTSYSYGNPLHRQPTLISRTDADGIIHKIYSSYPHDYSLVANTTSPLYAMAHQLPRPNVAIETYKTVMRPGGQEVLTEGDYTEYDFVGTSGQIVLPKYLYHTLLSQPVVYNSSNFAASSMSATPAPDVRYYELQQTLAYESNTSNLASFQPARGAMTSYQWSYADPSTDLSQLAVASFHNANRTPPVTSLPARGNEASYLSFESGLKVDEVPAEDYWRNLAVATTAGTLSTDKFTGLYSWRMGPATGSPNIGPTRVFQPTRQQLRYKLSAWVKTDAGFTANAGKLSLTVADASGGNLSCAECSKTISFGATQGQWLYVEVLIDLNAVHMQTGIPVNTTAANQLQITASTSNTGSLGYLIDDMVFQPVDAQATTYTYDAATRQPLSNCGPNNHPVLYEYDDLQRLKVVKDMRGNILKYSDYHYAQP